jgi:hypothetical protein
MNSFLIDLFQNDPWLKAQLDQQRTQAGTEFGTPAFHGAMQPLPMPEPAPPSMTPGGVPAPPFEAWPHESVMSDPERTEAARQGSGVAGWGTPEIQGPPLTREMPNGDMQVYREPEERKPGFFSQWGSNMKKALPDMITAGLASLATPSQYGGGPVDIARGVMAGQQAIKNRDLMAYNMEREKLKDQMEREKHTSTIKSQEAASRANEAASEASKARAERDKAESTKVDYLQELMKKWAMATDPVEKEALAKQINDFRNGPKPQGRWAPTGAGSVVNTESGEIKQVGPDPVELEKKKWQERFDWERSRSEKSLPDPKTGKPMYTRSPQEFWNSLPPETKIFINTGKEPQAKMDTSLDEREIALRAEGWKPGMEVTPQMAQGAMRRIQAAKQANISLGIEGRADAATERASLAAENKAMAEMQQVVKEEQNALDDLDKVGVRPGTKGGMTQAEWNARRARVAAEAKVRKDDLHRRIEHARMMRDSDYQSIGPAPYGGGYTGQPAPPAPNAGPPLPPMGGRPPLGGGSTPRDLFGAPLRPAPASGGEKKPEPAKKEEPQGEKKPGPSEPGVDTSRIKSSGAKAYFQRRGFQNHFGNLQ